jgi:hypothetical protein
MTATAPLILVAREHCGLCDELAEDLRRLGVRFEVLDVDANEALKQLYDDSVPVLLKAGVEIARAPFTQASLRNVLERNGALA